MNFKTIAAFIGLAACGAPTADDAVQLPTIAAASLPAPHSNNAVAAAVRGDEATFYSFYGLRAGKTGADVSMDVFACSMPEGVCSPIASPPVEQGRLGAVAVFLYDRIFLFGGYTAADDGSEVSMSDVYSY